MTQAREKRTSITLQIQDVEHQIEVLSNERNKVMEQHKEAEQAKSNQEQRKNDQTLEMAGIETSIVEKEQQLLRLENEVADKRKAFYASSDALAKNKNDLDNQCLKVKA